MSESSLREIFHCKRKPIRWPTCVLSSSSPNKKPTQSKHQRCSQTLIVIIAHVHAQAKENRRIKGKAFPTQPFPRPGGEKSADGHVEGLSRHLHRKRGQGNLTGHHNQTLLQIFWRLYLGTQHTFCQGGEGSHSWQTPPFSLWRCRDISEGEFSSFQGFNTPNTQNSHLLSQLIPWRKHRKKKDRNPRMPSV